MIPYRKSASPSVVGQIVLRINGRSVEAAIVAGEHGIVVSDTSALAKRLRTFRTSTDQRGASRGTPAVADSIGLGRLSITDYPIAIRPLPDGHQAVIGLDVLARYAPTFDPRTERVALRSTGTVARNATGVDEIPTLFTRDDVRVLQATGWMSINQPQVARILASRRWTLDARRGQLVVDR